MSTSTINGSAYPVDVEDLLPAAVDLALADDRVPSVNRLRTELKIGYEKARALHEQLTERAERWDAIVAETAGPAGPEVADEPAADEHADPLVIEAAEPAKTTRPTPARKVAVWPLFLLALPAAVAIWSGWVGLGGLTGFGVVHPLPGIWDSARLNTAITLPIGVEAYAAYALRAWLTPGAPDRARRFARGSAIGSLVLGALGQIAFHVMTAAGYTHAPVPITTLVACLPVGVLGMGAALAHLLRTTD